ncbi:MAG: N-acetylmuramoyl-L-alanine amidase [Rhodospirillaceae bacterium]|nr:N-acetylmuramoyl-L-alanine amidase [Rhodospirillaceae bacterium]
MSVNITCWRLEDRRGIAARSRRPGIVLRDRAAEDVNAIVLHQTSDHTLLEEQHLRPMERTPHLLHHVDNIRANFVVRLDGVIFYTHDVEVAVQSAGGFARSGIDIEFACNLPHTRQPPSDPAQRLTVDAILAGRRLIRALWARMRWLQYIHPHGQVQAALMDGRACGGDTGVPCGKLDSCPGPDIWVNVGAWAVRELHLLTTPVGRFQNNGISELMANRAYTQDLGFLDERTVHHARVCPPW